ncbi:unnamed protein product [Dimorphilus gyrociliatus]|uniref:Uncharacterized protein n=1 Tax=Dimorphilus gyrociliatus TaxID=2664684 RepID=A0A7I8VNL0_9ANNE|nr:unnamed protein product [Dimorphilus gyrociliatus]
MISRKHKNDGDNQLNGPPDKKLKESDKFDLWGDDDGMIDDELSKVDDETLSQCASQSIHIVNKNILGSKTNLTNAPVSCSILDLDDTQSSFKENPTIKDPMERARQEIENYKQKLDQMKNHRYQQDGEIYNLRQSIRQRDDQLAKLRNEKLDYQEKNQKDNIEKIKQLQKEVERYKGELAFKNHEITETEQFCKKLTHEMEMNASTNLGNITPVKSKKKSPVKTSGDFPNKSSFLMGPNVSESPDKSKQTKSIPTKISKKREFDFEVLQTTNDMALYNKHLITDTFLSSLQESEVLEVERAIHHLLCSNVSEFNEIEATAGAKRLLPFLLEHINNYLQFLSTSERNSSVPPEKLSKLFRDCIDILYYLVVDRSILVADWFKNEKESDVKMDIDDSIRLYSSPISLLASFFVPNLNYGNLNEKYEVLTAILRILERISYGTLSSEDILVLVRSIFLNQSMSKVMLETNDSQRDNDEYAKFCLQLLNLIIRICSFPDIAGRLCSKSKSELKADTCVFKALLYTLKCFRRRNDEIRMSIAERVISMCQTMIYSCDGDTLQTFCKCSTEISRCLILYTHSLYSILIKEQLSGEESFQEFEKDPWLRRLPKNSKEERLIILIRRGLRILKKLGITFRYVEANCQNVLKEFIELYQVIDRWLFGIKPYMDIDSPMCSLWDLGGDY